MLKKISRDILIIFGLAALSLSTSRQAMGYLYMARNSISWWGTHAWIYGDLVSISYLEFVSKFRTTFDYSVKRPEDTGNKNIELFLVGDSFTWHIHDSDFAGLNSFHLFDRYHEFGYLLDTPRKNIMLIEVSERFARDYFQDLLMLRNIHVQEKKQNSVSTFHSAKSLQSQSCSKYVAFLPGMNINDLFNPYINQNLEQNLFNYGFIMPMFQVKAALNYYLFSRASGNVVISDNKEFLFFKETVTPTGMESSYAPIYGDEMTKIINNINTIYNHYKADGFKEIYLSVIPNSATIMQPEGYNNFIPLLQNDPRLKMKVIDVYSVFKKNTDTLYYCPGDTHWNKKGRQKWIDLVNNMSRPTKSLHLKSVIYAYYSTKRTKKKTRKLVSA